MTALSSKHCTLHWLARKRLESFASNEPNRIISGWIWFFICPENVVQPVAESDIVWLLSTDSILKMINFEFWTKTVCHSAVWRAIMWFSNEFYLNKWFLSEISSKFDKKKYWKFQSFPHLLLITRTQKPVSWSVSLCQHGSSVCSPTNN